ncbi:MAG: hypothetical protein LBU80_03190 [Rikenellaceae bacterium]|jgi:hypothetical protein|nr:hypothetical protein [Rikenellaceae bacterium]
MEAKSLRVFYKSLRLNDKAVKAKTLTPAAMKRISTLICAGVLMSVLGTAFTACNNEPNEPEQKDEQKEPERPEEPTGEGVPFTMYPFGEESSVRWPNPDYNTESKLLVINSDEELRRYVDGDYPPIEFAKKTLLLASGGTPQSGTEPIVKYFKESSQDYRLHIDVIMGDAASPDFWQVAILTDKLSNDSKVELSVKIIN